MATSEPTNAKSARSEDQEPAYEGARGRTRLRSVHVTLPNGFVRLVQVYDSVNVATDPHLKEPALAGALHRFETGEALAIPFIYHDPGARKLALVVPTTLRHEELRLRSELLADLDGDRESPIPGYVAEAKTVVGTGELEKYLASKHSSAAAGELEEKERELSERETALEERASDIEVKQDALAQREARLHARAEAVTRREDELRSFAEELEASRADVGMQEQELEARFEMLHERESDLLNLAESGASAITSSVEDDVVQLVDDEDVAGMAEVIEEVELLEDVEELEPLETSPAAIPEDLSSAVEMVVEAMQPDLDDDVEEIADDDVEELEDVVPIEDITGVHSNPLPDELESSATVIADVLAEPVPEPEGPSPTEPPPPAFDERSWGADAAAVLGDDGVRIHARLPSGIDAAFSASDHDLLVQLVVVEERPVVLLTVVEKGNARATALRAPFDPRAEDGRELLEKLRRDCRARVALHDTDGKYLRSVDAAGPREVNVLRIIERVSKMRTAAAVDVRTAIERVLGTPPPTSSKEHPFVGEAARVDAGSAVAAKKALDELEKWSSHDRMDRALLGLSIPADHVDGTVRHLLEQAVAHGLPLTPRLRDHAISHDVAVDAAELVAKQIESFAKTTKLSGNGGLSGEEAASSWEALLEAAADAEVAIDTDTHEHAWTVIRKVRGGDVADVDPADFPKLSVKELALLLEHPKYRRDAAIELASRKEPDTAERLCRAVRKMPRAEVVVVVPKIVAIGDEVGDALIDGLGARKTFVRQAFALSLGHLKLRRAVVPLLHLLASEESDVWREVSRVLGGFGTASHRTVSRQLKDPKGPKERYVLTLAHLANHGCEKQVDKLTKDDRPPVASMAVESLTLRQEAKSADDRARGEMKLLKKDPVLQFSRRFYAELDGRATDEDLED